jgi:UDP-galactopyranose mutase
MSRGEKRVGVVGCGWAGATCARVLADAGVRVDVFEAADTVGGHSRTETLNGVVYEPNGAHIFHTDDDEVAAFVTRFGASRSYRHEVAALIHPYDDDEAHLVSWPPQIDELRALRIWPRIESELARCPARPAGDDFETFAISLMGPTLYQIFVYGYTRKQWGCEPRSLSSSFAPKRLDLRRDGDRRLFKDRYQLFEPRGFNAVIERIAAPAVVHTGARVGIDDMATAGASFDAWGVTAALDELLGAPDALPWRGIESRPRYHRVAAPDDTVTPRYVINHPDVRYPFTRTVETKHATGQSILASVVCEEHPGAPARHYPVPTIDGVGELRNDELRQEVVARCPVPVDFCGRLATYRYINQDQAIRQGIDCARRLLTMLHI